MIKFIKKYFKLLDRLLFTALEDLESWRNKLIVGSFILCILAIGTSNGIIATAAFGAWTVIVTFYFQKRENAEQNGYKHNSKFDVVEPEETDETFEEND